MSKFLKDSEERLQDVKTSRCKTKKKKINIIFLKIPWSISKGF